MGASTAEFVSDVLKSVARGETLDETRAESFMNLLMEGQTTPVQTAGLLAAMAVRGETVEEIVGFARAMRNHSLRLNAPDRVIDTCGTGGDGADTFNISTASAFVCAAAGAPVAKHGNRAVSSRSGSADVLQALGAEINLDVSAAELCLRDVNLCFLFAQSYHPAMKYAAEPRKQLGFRTIFNILGPLTNPANAKRQVVGVFQPSLVPKVAHALLRLGSEHALVVHGAGGLDEISIAGETRVAEVKDGEVREYTIHPEMFGLPISDLSHVVGGDARENAEIIRALLAGERSPRRDIVLLNAGAALYVAGRVATLQDGVIRAAETIDAGAAARTLRQFVLATRQYQAAEVAQ
ncbi:anthranilate phosphoribosyltransferase [Alicyclobacillus cycloheptanicus]|jgi:anthranilate phosphoribosyltransferase|uniref:Anthranilate phosphoribosyltransferase n=1 Tax=Alicyclobacillus cycloheptanicus TaxID=1457 RepID=A0ABT9XE16_9BACL|nr:anthranilate phosphoribosyltransferase [Alicyclobacillus cycloheptanicus]MDQ0188545.1 anthranilate phosphoribosyltransferase [Alicyclobacillus cycloheptanicus]WDM01230.1 anthranilate phosphoribosyltransferase [Alicyclobacillus cycloheptanicus]